tara:strand:+ start:688 stop:1755 length:1068 start_codon:yes stop_codon:yes gene_type:complete
MQKETEGIHGGEIWQASQCLEHEHNTNTAIYQLLGDLGFQSTDRPRIWKKGTQTVINCLVDDIRSCATDYHLDLPYLFDKNTTIITDNYITCPTQYKVIRLPISFIGIYHYVPQQQQWDPVRDFAFAVNRIDQRRFLLLLELGLKVHLHKGHVNFNCYRPPTVPIFGAHTSPHKETALKYWAEQWEQHTGPEDKASYQRSYDVLTAQIPVCNYEIEHDEIFTQSYLSIVAETYSSDNNISLSEKLFRALVTPAPWTVSSGRYTVAYLHSMGFDTVSELVDHNHYDRLIEVQDKQRIFVWKSLEIIKLLKAQDRDALKLRFQQAAQHNQQLLAKMFAQWPADFEAWTDQLRRTLLS